MDDVSCIGTELYLEQCLNDELGVHNCLHYEDAALVCRGKHVCTDPLVCVYEPINVSNIRHFVCTCIY